MLEKNIVIKTNILKGFLQMNCVRTHENNGRPLNFWRWAQVCATIFGKPHHKMSRNTTRSCVMCFWHCIMLSERSATFQHATGRTNAFRWGSISDIPQKTLFLYQKCLKSRDISASSGLCYYFRKTSP